MKPPRRHYPLDYHHGGHTRPRPVMNWVKAAMLRTAQMRKPKPTQPIYSVQSVLATGPRPKLPVKPHVAP